jgi:hypothetical protein
MRILGPSPQPADFLMDNKSVLPNRRETADADFLPFRERPADAHS